MRSRTGGIPELIGSVGRLSVATGAGRPGEVVIAIRGGSEAYTAWSDEPLDRNTKVLVLERISARSVQVTRLL